MDKAPWRKNVGLEDIERVMLHAAAISETLSCSLVLACLERATDETTRVLFSNLVADEIHHARFGWYYLSWPAPRWSQAERQRLRRPDGEQRRDGGAAFLGGTRRAAVGK